MKDEAPTSGVSVEINGMEWSLAITPTTEEGLLDLVPMGIDDDIDHASYKCLQSPLVPSRPLSPLSPLVPPSSQAHSLLLDSLRSRPASYFLLFCRFHPGSQPASTGSFQLLCTSFGGSAQLLGSAFSVSQTSPWCKDPLGPPQASES